MNRAAGWEDGLDDAGRLTAAELLAMSREELEACLAGLSQEERRWARRAMLQELSDRTVRSLVDNLTRGALNQPEE